jgi:hypothetical protein
MRAGLEPVLIEKMYYEYDIEGRGRASCGRRSRTARPTMYHVTDQDTTSRANAV